MRCVGYRRMWQHLEGQISYDDMISKGIVPRAGCKTSANVAARLAGRYGAGYRWQ